MKPILFNTDMVRAILDGRKTQTRRIVKTGSYTPLEIGRSKFYTFRDELNGKPGAWAGFYCNRDVFVGRDGKLHIDAVYAKAPYQPGDTLYVRETWAPGATFATEGKTFYRADDDYGDNILHWHPSIHMPKEAARIFLRVTDVRVERLRDIDENGAIAEGLYKGWRLCGMGSLALSARQAFMWLWETITRKAPAADSWACNPWVWVISFERYDPADPEGGAVNDDR